MSINILQDQLINAAKELAKAYIQEREQCQLEQVEPHPSIQIPLDELLKLLANKGALVAVMSSGNIRGNQSKAAKIMGINRATLRTRLVQLGHITPKEAA